MQSDGKGSSEKCNEGLPPVTAKMQFKKAGMNMTGYRKTQTKAGGKDGSEKQILAMVRDLSVEFNDNGPETEVVKGISFPIYEGEILGVVGESGSGKSMTALAMMGLLPERAKAERGSIEFSKKDGETVDLLKLSPKEMQKVQGREISMVFQEPMTSLNPVMKIGRQVGENLELHTELTREEIRERSAQALEQVGLSEPEELLERYPHELSGGMRQRVMIAQAMIAAPRLLIADEPTTALDVIVQAQILKLLRRIHEEQNTSILFISHDLNVIREICDRVLVIYKGVIVEEGEVSQVLNHPQHEYTKRLVASIPQAARDTESGKEILNISHLDVFYREGGGIFKKPSKKHVLCDVNLTVKEGEILGIVGESGCGKSTLSKTIVGLNRDYSGEIHTEGELHPQMVFQDPFGSLNPARKIGWILEEPLRLRGIRDRSERRRLAEEMLVKIGLDESFYSRRPRELSGGQRQRISIGAALLADSRLLVADEPVSALDVTVQSQILKLLLDIHQERKNTLLFVSHDLNIVRRICHRVAVLYLGEVVESGDVEEIYRNPCHPYTRLLLESSLGGEKEKDRKEMHLSSDIGETFGRESAGCPFFPRCPKRTKQCESARPEVIRLEDAHEVKCFLFAEEKTSPEQERGEA